MRAFWRGAAVLAGLLAAGAVVFCAGITWGLPSRNIDRYLFGQQPVWTGPKILELAGGWSDDPNRGADVDIDPLQRAGPVPLNETDAQRAAILLRYRLYTYQPDELITMRSLAGMRPAELRFDPRLYQYGGLWIYPVGGLLKLASMAGAVRLTTDLGWYLDHPEAFGRLYVVARLYTVAWALAGVCAVFWLARRLSGGSLAAAATAAACYIAMPVVINMAHEAKPHLPGAVLMLLAVIAAVRYSETGRARWWIGTGLLCGAAFGMVLSALPIFIIIPVMLLLRRDTWMRRALKLVFATACGAVIYFAVNPYVAINWLRNPAVLQSNLGNSVAMYEVGRWPEGLANAAFLMAEGTSIVLAVLGVIAVVYFAACAFRRTPTAPEGPRRVRVPSADKARGSDPGELLASVWGAEIVGSGQAGSLSRSAAILLAAPALLILLQFVALAAGKPGEYGRFAVFPGIAAGLAAVTFVWRSLAGISRRPLAMAMLIAFTAAQGYPYLHAFVRDSSQDTSRIVAADRLQSLLYRGMTRLAVLAEPAPYVMPPFDLFRWKLVLLPPEPAEPPPAAALIAVDVASDRAAKLVPPNTAAVGLSRGVEYRGHVISWANRAFQIWPLAATTEPAGRAAQ